MRLHRRALVAALLALFVVGAGAAPALAGQVGSRTTYQDPDAPAPVSGLTMTRSGADDDHTSVTLSWDTPIDPHVGEVVVGYAVGTAPPATVNDGTFVSVWGRTSTVITDLWQLNYAFSVFVRDRLGRVSTPVNLYLDNPTVTSIELGGTNIQRVGVPFDLIGYVGRPHGGRPVMQAPVQLSFKAAGSISWQVLADGVTNTQSDTNSMADGSFRFTITPTGNGVYRVRHVSTRAVSASYVDVAVTVMYQLTSTMKPLRAKVGTTFVLSGRLGPDPAGKAVLLQYYHYGWRSLARRTVTATGAFAFRIKPTGRGRFLYRAIKSGDSNHTYADNPYWITAT